MNLGLNKDYHERYNAKVMVDFLKSIMKPAATENPLQFYED